MRGKRNGSGAGESGCLQKKHNVKEVIMEIIGHQKQWQYLAKLAEADKLPHALLFFGEEKIGKKTLAIEFAKLLLKEDVEKKLHSDFIFIEPGKREIQISQIRELIWKLSLKPFLASLKVAIIDQAHCLNEEAQSCLLKTLEEPKGSSLLILITEYPEMLLPTILSRVQKIRFRPPELAEIEDYLAKKGFEKEELSEIIKFSLAKPGEVMDLVSDPQKLTSRKKTISNLVKILNSDIAFRFQCAKDISQKQPQDLKETLETWLRYSREILISTISSQQLSRFDINTDIDIDIDRDIDRFRTFSLNQLKSIINQIQNTNLLLSRTNVNPRLALENLMLEI
jgi:DNA polymerase-3 subunit delta'